MAQGIFNDPDGPSEKWGFLFFPVPMKRFHTMRVYMKDNFMGAEAWGKIEGE